MLSGHRPSAASGNTVTDERYQAALDNVFRYQDQAERVGQCVPSALSDRHAEQVQCVWRSLDEYMSLLSLYIVQRNEEPVLDNARRENSHQQWQINNYLVRMPRTYLRNSPPVWVCVNGLMWL